MSCSSHPENAGPPGLNINHSGGPGLSSEPGGLFFFFFFLGNQQNPAKAGLQAKPGTLLPLSSHKSVKKAATFPQSRRGLGLRAQRWDGPCRSWRMAGCTPRGGKPPAQPWALQLPPPGGDGSVRPRLGAVGGCQGRLLSWDEQRFSPGSPRLGRDLQVLPALFIHGSACAQV